MTDPSCTGKAAYSRERAQQIARDMKRGRRGANRLNVYHCDSCGFWHIGSHMVKHPPGQQRPRIEDDGDGEDERVGRVKR